MTFEKFYHFELSHFCAKAYRFYCTEEQQNRLVSDAKFRAEYYVKCKEVFDRVYFAFAKLDYAVQVHKAAQRENHGAEIKGMISELDQFTGGDDG